MSSQCHHVVKPNYDGLESPMLHTKFLGNRPTGSREDFWRAYTICGRGGHLGHVIRYRKRNLNATSQGGFT